MKQVVSNLLKGLRQIGEETGKELVTQTGKIAESIITGKELLGDIKPLSEKEVARKQNEDEQKKQAEINRLKSQMGQGRNVESEIQQIVEEKKKKEEEEERIFLENLRRQREAEEQERQEMMEMEMASANPHKAKKKRGGAFAPKGKSQSSTANMSATNEYGKKPD